MVQNAIDRLASVEFTTRDVLLRALRSEHYSRSEFYWFIAYCGGRKANYGKDLEIVTGKSREQWFSVLEQFSRSDEIRYLAKLGEAGPTPAV